MPSANKKSSDYKSHVLAQGLAEWITQSNHERRIPLYEALDALQGELDLQEQAFGNALSEIDWVRTKIGSPENILGSEKTKHGEIAEIAEVGIRRARDILVGRTPNAFWNEADRLGAEDYGIGGIPVQSKFINGVNNGLRHVISHAERYPDFGSNDGGFYHIPRDQHDTILRVMKGDTDGFNPRTVAAIQSKVQSIEHLRGRPFDDIVQPASHNYADVMQGKIHDTLDGHESDLSDKNRALKQQIKEEHSEEVKTAQAKAAPTLGEMGQIAAKGAAVGAGLNITVHVYKRWAQDGRPPTQFTQDDWKEIGGSALSGGTAGGISAAALYGLTNYSTLSAPFAGAVVSSGRAMVTLTQQYQNGNISYDEYTDLSLIATTEAGIAAAGAALGQALIPVPVLGAVIGSSTARLVSMHAKTLLEKEADQLAERIDLQFEQQIASLTREHRLILARLDAKMLRLGDLTSTAFDLNINAHLLLLSSMRLAEAHGVPDALIIRSTNDVDAFILGTDSPTTNQHGQQVRRGG